MPGSTVKGQPDSFSCSASGAASFTLCPARWRGDLRVRQGGLASGQDELVYWQDELVYGCCRPSRRGSVVTK
eukprot:100317-Chlamydomonas_euryale.AAC.1